MPKNSIPSKWLQSKWLIDTSKEVDRDSLVRIPTDKWDNERERKEEWAESDSNQRPPPCQGGILTRLDHRPHIHAGKFIAQIYVIDPLSCGNTSFSQFYKDDSCCNNRNLLKKSECDAM